MLLPAKARTVNPMVDHTGKCRYLLSKVYKEMCCRTFHRQLHRTWALKYIAALTTRLGKDGIVPYLHQILQPLYRIQESGSAPNTDEVPVHIISSMLHERHECCSLSSHYGVDMTKHVQRLGDWSVLNGFFCACTNKSSHNSSH